MIDEHDRGRPPTRGRVGPDDAKQGAHPATSPVRTNRMSNNSILLGYGASELTGVPINTLKDYRQKDKGPESAVIAGRVKYRRADILAWIDEQFTADAAKSTRVESKLSPLGKRSLVDV